MFKNLLICSDGSEFSEGAVREGLKLAKLSGGKTTMLHVIEFNPEFEALAPNLVEKMEAGAGEDIEALKSRAEKEGVPCTASIKRAERPHTVIVDEAEKIKADAIVMGRRGRTGLKRVIMGSVTARVIGHATRNVLVVPRAARIDCRGILIATDGSRCAEAASRQAVAIAKSCGAPLTVVSVLHDEAMPSDFLTLKQRESISKKALSDAEKCVQDVKDLAGKEGVKAEGLIMTGSPSEAVIKAAEDKKADLIVMGSHGRTGIERLLMGSVTERVVNLASKAVLIVKTGI